MSSDEITSFIHDAEELAEKSAAYPGLPRVEREELILALADLRDERAGEFLAAVLPGETDRELQKLIRKGLFKLKTMGIKVEEPHPSGEPVLRTIGDKRQHRAFMSNYDADGTRIVVVALQVKKGYYLFLNAIAHIFKGLTDLKLAPLARHDLDAIIAEYLKAASSLSVFVEISPAYAAFLIDEADSISHRYVDDVRQLKQFASGLKDGIQRPGDLYSFPALDDVVPLPASVVLSDDLFKSFNLSWDTMEADKAALAAAGGSTLLVPPQMVQEKLERFLADLLQTEPLKAKVPFIKRLLEDYGYIYFLSGRLDCFVTLMALLKNERGPLGVLSFFVGKALEMKEPQADREGGLIVDPYGQVRR